MLEVINNENTKKLNLTILDIINNFIFCTGIEKVWKKVKP